MTAEVKACVIGWPITHSRSPMIHGYWLKKYGIEGSYIKEAVHPRDFPDFFKSMKNHGLVGGNITVPHKETAYALADEVRDCAKAIRAANTIWLEGDKICAANTDTYGYMTHLKTSAPDWDKMDAPAVVLGAGGAARAIIHGLINNGVPEIRLSNRTKDRASELADFFGSRVKVVDWGKSQEALNGAGTLINTTTLGMTGSDALKIDLSPMKQDAVVSDIVYAPLETPLLAQAKQKGLTPVDGLGMLLHQAVPGFEIWFGVRPEVTPELRDLVIADLEKSK
ncbi:MAG: shikimate dehydrogenase [Methyloligellaceae bacterium]